MNKEDKLRELERIAREEVEHIRTLCTDFERTRKEMKILGIFDIVPGWGKQNSKSIKEFGALLRDAEKTHRKIKHKLNNEKRAMNTEERR